jgi:hypothetical protein
MRSQLKTLTLQKKRVMMPVKKFLELSVTLPLTPMDFLTPLRSQQLTSQTEMGQLKW